MRDRLPLLILLAALGAALGGCHPPPPARLAASAPLPPVEVQTLDGTALPLPAALAGRPALVSLWATWCEACRTELPALARLSAKVGQEGVVVAVAVGEERDAVAAFVRAHGLGGEQLVDEKYGLADALGQSRIPATLVVDRAGRIVYRGGLLDREALAAFRKVLWP